MEIQSLHQLEAWLGTGRPVGGLRIQDLDLTTVASRLRGRTDLAGLVVLGGVVPAGAPLTLDAPEALRAEYFTERRELGVLNIGGAGAVTVDGTRHAELRRAERPHEVAAPAPARVLEGRQHLVDPGEAAGDALGIDLLNNPNLVATDPAVAWKTGLWYWNTQNGPGTMTPHAAMVNGAGFGETIRSINGAIECNGGNPAQVQSRVDNYTEITSLLGLDPGGNLYC